MEQETLGKEFYESADKVIIIKKQEMLEESKTTGDIGVDYAFAQSKAIQKCMHLDAEMAYRSLPKQETLEGVAERLVPEAGYELNNSEASYWQQGWINGHIEGTKWQQERSYSEEEVKNLTELFLSYYFKSDKDFNNCYNEWFEQFKKK